MAIGLLGGTFDPIHIGHLRSAEEIRERFGLDRVIFIPAGHPPHKTRRQVLAARHRFAMARLAIAQNPAFAIDDLELRKPEPSYTIDTLRAFRRDHEATEIHFILGIDAFQEFATWNKYESIFTECNLVVTTRPQYTMKSLGEILPPEMAETFRLAQDPRGARFIHPCGTSVHIVAITFLEISSTRIREAVRAGRSIRYLVPREVEQYITMHGLYRR